MLGSFQTSKYIRSPHVALYTFFFFFSLGGGQSAYNPDGGGVGWLGSDSQIV